MVVATRMNMWTGSWGEDGKRREDGAKRSRRRDDSIRKLARKRRDMIRYLLVTLVKRWYNKNILTVKDLR